MSMAFVSVCYEFEGYWEVHTHSLSRLESIPVCVKHGRDRYQPQRQSRDGDPNVKPLNIGL